jgi:hypothetical protein
MDGAHSLARRNGTQPFYGIFGRTGTTKSLSALGSPFQLAAADSCSGHAAPKTWAASNYRLGLTHLQERVAHHPKGGLQSAQHFQAQDKRCMGDSASLTPEGVRVGRLSTHGTLHWDCLEA